MSSITIKKVIKRMSMLVIALLIMAFLLVFLGFRLPFVQKQLGRSVSSYLSKKTNSNISIDKVGLYLMDRVRLDQVYFPDEKSDTLISFDHLAIDINLWQLFRKKLEIDKIVLDKVNFNLLQSEEKEFNFQYLINAFASNAPKENKEHKKAPWKIELNELRLTKANGILDLKSGYQEVNLNKLQIKLESFDLVNLDIIASKIIIDEIQYIANLSQEKKERTPPINSYLFPLSTIPISVECKSLEIKNSFASIKTGNQTSEGTFNPQHILAHELNLDFKDIIFNDKVVSTNVKNLSALMDSSFNLLALKGQLLFAKNETSAKKLHIQTNKTDAELSVILNYESFEELVQFGDDLRIELNSKTLEIHPDDLAYWVPSLDKSKYPFLDKKLIANIEAKGSIGDLQIKQFDISSGQNKLHLDGQVSNATDINKMTLRDISLKTNLPASELAILISKDKLPIDIATFGEIKLNTSLSGSLEKLTIHQLELITDANTYADFNGTIENILTPSEIRYDLLINEIRTNRKDIVALVKDLPEQFDKIDIIDFNGIVRGTLNSFDVDGQLNTNLGSINPDVIIRFNEDYSDATYEGEIEIDDFDLGAILNDSTMGNTALVIKVEGSGLDPNNIKSNIDVSINSFTYRDYEYKDVSVDGVFDERRFNGKINIKDENVKLDFVGQVDLNSKAPKFDFTSKIEEANLQILNLVNFPLIISAEIDSDINGIQLEQLQGYVHLNNTDISTDKGLWKADSIYLSSIVDTNDHVITSLFSPIIEGQIEGQYTLKSLPLTLMKIVDSYFPISDVILTEALQDSMKLLSNDVINASFNIHDITEVSQLFTDQVKQADTIQFDIEMDKSKNYIKATLETGVVEFGGISANAIHLLTDTLNHQLNSTILIDSVNTGGKIDFPQLGITAAAGKGQGAYNIFLESDAISKNLDISGEILRYQDMVELTINNQFELNKKRWNLEMYTPFLIGKDHLEIPSIEMYHKNETLMLNHFGSSFQLAFEQFEIDNLLATINMSAYEVDGKIDGILDVEQSEDLLTIDGDLYVNNLEYNDVPLGDIKMDFNNRGVLTTAEIIISGLNNDLTLNATLAEGNTLNGLLEIEKIDLQSIEPFISNFAQDISGQLNGNLELDGTVQAPDLSGKLEMNDVGLKVMSLGSYYQIKSGILDFDLNEIVTDFTFVDSLSRTALLTGSIYHRNFKNIQFDLNLSTDAFTFLNAPKEKGSQFYGTLNAFVEAQITGSMSNPDIYIDFETADDTDVTVVATSKKGVISYEDYIIFYDGESYDEEGIKKLLLEQFEVKTNLNMTIKADIRETAKLKIVIDPVTEDYLDIIGTGDLIVKTSSKEGLLITGAYEVVDGTYHFSYQEFLKKPFKIQEDSKIIFNGKIMDAQLDILAVYETRSSTAALAQSEGITLTDDETVAANKKIDVEVLLSVTGPLKNIAESLAFDIQFPESSSNQVESNIERALESLKSDESDLYTQVFSLLLLNSFSYKNISSNIANAGTDVLFSSLTGLIEDQLAKLTNNVKGLEIDFDIDNYRDQDTGEGSVTEFGVAIRQTILNDRIIITVEGNVDLESGNEENSALTNVAGDFIMEFKLTPDGKLRLSVFQKSDYNIVSQDNTWQTGIGFSHQTSFGKIISSKQKDKQVNNKTKKKRKDN